MNKKAILLAGGAGTRLYPLTKIVCKQLLPVYDKPMICYPLATLMLGGLREVLIISTPKDLPMLEDYLGDGARLGIRIEYAAQPKPEGNRAGFLDRRGFSRRLRRVAHPWRQHLLREPRFLPGSARARDTAPAFSVIRCAIRKRYGVVEFGADGRALSLEEKPTEPKSNFAIPGLYVYDERVVEFCRAAQALSRAANWKSPISISFTSIETNCT